MGSTQGCSEGDAPVEEVIVPVSVVTVEKASTTPTWSFIGRTAPSRKAAITSRTQAEIRNINFTEGERVEEGQVLVSLESNNANADLRQAEAELIAANAEVQSAARNLRRGEEIAVNGYLSAADLDKLKDRFSQAQGRQEAAQSATQRAQQALEYTEIRAPFSGWVGKANFDPGAVVSPSSGPIAEVVQTDPMFVEFQVNEADFLAYRNRDSSSEFSQQLDLTLTLADGDQHEHDGELSFTDIRVDERMGTVAARAAFPNPDATLVPGLFVTLNVEQRQGVEKILVPQVALQENNEGKFVLLVDENDRVAQRFIQTGARQGALWTVEAGLDGGEAVIVEGIQKVRTGVQVEPLEKRIDAMTGVIQEASGGVK
ncbi:MAG: efflux RND transporter periplasmic adaptor subunit [Halomonas sp.]|nr:efflux RND transporter periplasmic adaptor subunit [Halomonas sp.]